MTSGNLAFAIAHDERIHSLIIGSSKGMATK